MSSYIPHISQIAKVAEDPDPLINWAKTHSKKYCDTIFKKAGDRGTAVHEVLQNAMNGLETEGNYIEFSKAIIAWKNLVGYEPIENEYRVRYQNKFQGTLDSFGTIGGKYTLPDWKITTRIRLSHMVQTAGYALGLGEEHGVPIDTLRVLRLYPLKKPAKKTTTSTNPFNNSNYYSFEGISVRAEEKVVPYTAYWKDIFIWCLEIYELRREWEKTYARTRPKIS